MSIVWIRNSCSIWVRVAGRGSVILEMTVIIIVGLSEIWVCIACVVVTIVWIGHSLAVWIRITCDSVVVLEVAVGGVVGNSGVWVRIASVVVIAVFVGGGRAIWVVVSILNTVCHVWIGLSHQMAVSCVLMV
jgi:hypothetical protein